MSDIYNYEWLFWWKGWFNVIFLSLGDPAFNCPQTHYQYPAEDFSCQQQIFNSLLSQTLENPVGQVYVYSDLR